jgi:hypothetical protein
VNKLASALVVAVDIEGGLLLAKAFRDVAPLESALDLAIERIAFLRVWVNSPGDGPLRAVPPGEKLGEGGFCVQEAREMVDEK